MRPYDLMLDMRGRACFSKGLASVKWSAMQAFIIRRILAVIPTLIFTSVIVFASIRMIPGDVIDLMLAQNDISTGNDRALIEASLGLDKPIYVQYFVWAGNLLQGSWRLLWRYRWPFPLVSTRRCGKTPRAIMSHGHSRCSCWPSPVSGWEPW